MPPKPVPGRGRGDRGRGGNPTRGRGGIQGRQSKMRQSNQLLNPKTSTMQRGIVQRDQAGTSRGKLIGGVLSVIVVLGGIGAGVFMSTAASDESANSDLTINPTKASTTTTAVPKVTTTTTPPPPVVLDEKWIKARGECGRPRQKPNLGRIVGGTEAVKHSWPWQIGLLQYKRYDANTASVKAICGGSLVGPKYVISASHCFLNKKRTSVSKDKDRYRVLVGAHDKGRESHGAKMLEIESLHHHPDNNMATFTRLKQIPAHDITVIILKTIVDPNDISPMTGFVCLPQPKLRPHVGKNCWATGWGLTSGTGFDKVLKQVKQPVTSQSNCIKKYGGRKINYDVHVCAGPHKGNQGTCQGDSGGPLVCQYEDGAWVLHGDTSFGPKPCGSSPGVWAQVSYHMDFVCCVLRDYGPCKDMKCEMQ
ncbi:chymotrypsinogen A-like isoform X1 [Styela clava]